MSGLCSKHKHHDNECEICGDLLSTLLQLALSPRELEVLKIMVHCNVYEFKKIAAQVPFSSGYLAVILKRLQAKGFLQKEENEIQKTQTYFFKFNELMVYLGSYR